MEELIVSLDLRGFRGLLNGLRMKLFPGSNDSITMEELIGIYQKSNVELDSNDIENEISLFESVSNVIIH
jgi:hypothetical protein